MNFLITNRTAPLQDKDTDRFTTFYYPQTNLSRHIVLDSDDDIISSEGRITASIDSDNLYSLCAKEKPFITQCYNDDRDTTILETDNDINGTLSDGDNVQIMTQTVYIDISYLVVPLLYSHLLTFIHIYIIVSPIVDFPTEDSRFLTMGRMLSTYVSALLTIFFCDLLLELVLLCLCILCMPYYFHVPVI